MTTKISKSNQIRQLLHLPNAVIAERVGCLDAYVRVVRQRTDPDGSSKTPDTTRNYRRWWRAENRERHNAYERERRKRRAEAHAS